MLLSCNHVFFFTIALALNGVILFSISILFHLFLPHSSWNFFQSSFKILGHEKHLADIKWKFVEKLDRAWVYLRNCYWKNKHQYKSIVIGTADRRLKTSNCKTSAFFFNFQINCIKNKNFIFCYLKLLTLVWVHIYQ